MAARLARRCQKVAEPVCAWHDAVGDNDVRDRHRREGCRLVPGEQLVGGSIRSFSVTASLPTWHCAPWPDRSLLSTGWAGWQRNRSDSLTRSWVQRMTATDQTLSVFPVLGMAHGRWRPEGGMVNVRRWDADGRGS